MSGTLTLTERRKDPDGHWVVTRPDPAATPAAPPAVAPPDPPAPPKRPDPPWFAGRCIYDHGNISETLPPPHDAHALAVLVEARGVDRLRADLAGGLAWCEGLIRESIEALQTRVPPRLLLKYPLRPHATSVPRVKVLVL